MLSREEEALQTDAYIDALLAAHAGRARPAAGLAVGAPPPISVRRAIELLDGGLPRFHPSFLFEEALAARLRAASLGRPAPADDELIVGEVITLPADFLALEAGALDRRLLLGGAIASGVSLAGAAVVAWRMRERGRSRRRWLA